MNDYQKAWQKKCIYLGIFFISLFASLLHFLYEFSGKSSFVGFFTPVNESVWEHLKLVLLPTIVWWIISYVIYGKKNNVSFRKWFAAMVLAIVVAQLFIVVFYYTYTGAFGIKNLFLDIASLYIGIIIAQFVGVGYLNKYHKKWCFYFAICILVLILLAFIIFTFEPPHLPIFLDQSTGKYGPK